MDTQAETKKWLIKNNNRIVGPFTESEIRDQIVNNVLSPFATACIPGQIFWIFITTYSEFKDHTGKFSNTAITRTIKASQTLTTTSAGNTETKKIVIGGGIDKTPYDLQEFLYQSASSRKKSNKRSWFLGLVCISVLVVGATFFVKNEFSKDKEKRGSQYGRAFFNTGNYLRALNTWEENIDSLSELDKISLQLLKFQLKNNLSQGEKILNQKGMDPAERMITQALIYVKTDDLEAAEKLFNNLMEDDFASSNIKQAAFFNLSLLSAKKQTGCSFFEENKNSSFGGRKLFLFASAFCHLKSNINFKPAKNNLQKIALQPWEYYQEALLGLTYIRVKKGEEVSFAVEKLLDNDPYLTELHHYSIYVDRNIYSWTELLPFCKSIYLSDKEDFMFITLYAYCLARSNDYELAQQTIKQAVLANSQSALVKSVNAYINTLINFKEQAVLILGDAIRSNTNMKYVLPYILQARFCEKNKAWDCAVENWQYIFNKHTNSISSLGGLVTAKYHQGHLDEAQAYLKRGAVMEKTILYSPLLFVKEQLK